MSLYCITIHFEEDVESDCVENAIASLEEQVAGNNETLLNHILENVEITELCPHCEEVLENKIIDVDGRNLEEHLICEKCDYGMPALK